MKIVTGKVRFSYVHVWEPASINGSDPKYSVSLIIPKSDTAALEKIKAAIEVAKKEGIARLGGTVPEDLKTPLKDGEIDMPDNEAYVNSYFINANSSMKPGIVDKDVQAITDQSKFYSGCYGRASITFYAYNVNGSKGIACGLQNLQKLSDGERIDGHSRPEEDFDAVQNAEEDFLN